MAICGLAVVVLLIGVYAVLGRFVLHGPVTAHRLHESVAAQTTGSSLDFVGDCRRARAPRVWTCEVPDRGGSGSVEYRVLVEEHSSCWTARLLRIDGEGAAPQGASGCVMRWQWSLL